ncbi:MAG: S41 family peptidase [Chloroflexota bacterium]|nr:S41 family peptidase [Chloroflexota bacterium]
MLTRVRSRAVLAALLALAFMLGACGVATPRATETPQPTVIAPRATDTPSGPTATPTPDPAVLLRDGGIALIQTAYDRLLDEYIDPLEPQSLLSQAWYGVQKEASAEGLAPPAAPALSGDRAGDFSAFREAYVPLAAQAADASKLRYAAIKTMASSLNDCHTFFLIPVASDTLNGTRQGVGSVGIGVELAGVPPLVTEVVAGGPAAREGVLVGDRIAAIDGSDATNLGPQGALDLINGTEGTTVGLRLRRAGQSQPVEVSIRRERVIPRNVDSRVIGDTGVGYVRVRNFVDSGIAGPVKDALTQFEATGVTKWIIDLRGDPGGLMDARAIGLFLPKGDVVERDRGRGGVTTDQEADGNTLPVIRPLVLLTNNRTGSVAEAFAAALQEYGVAYVVGEKTNGCVGFTDIAPLGDGSSIAVTTHVGLGPVSNKVLNGVGVIPDEPVARTQADIANANDPQLDVAVAHLRSR